MRVVADIPNNPEALAASLEGKIEESIAQWRAHPEWRSLYETRIRYQRQPGPEKYQSSEETRKRGQGDCDHFTVDRVAELRARHGEFGAAPYIYQTGPTTWHAVVRRGDGTIEDPSKIQKARERRGWPPMNVNGDDDEIPAKAKVDLQKLADGRMKGVVSWQTKDARVTIEAIGDGPTHAMDRTLAVARSVANHPLVRQLVPPQAAVAITAAEKLVGLAKRGDVQRVAKRLKGPALKLARKLF